MRYKQTAIDVIWVIIQPLLSNGVFTIFCGRLAKLPSDGLTYPVFHFTAAVSWTYFATALQQATNDFVALVFVTLDFKIIPGTAVLWLPVFLLLVVATALGIGLWLSALNALSRRVLLYVIGFLLQFWMLHLRWPTPPAWRRSVGDGFAG